MVELHFSGERLQGIYHWQGRTSEFSLWRPLKAYLKHCPISNLGSKERTFDRSFGEFILWNPNRCLQVANSSPGTCCPKSSCTQDWSAMMFLIWACLKVIGPQILKFLPVNWIVYFFLDLSIPLSHFQCLYAVYLNHHFSIFFNTILAFHFQTKKTWDHLDGWHLSKEMMLLVAETTGLDASGITAVSSPPSTPLPRDIRSEPQVDSVKALRVYVRISYYPSLSIVL